VVKDNFVEGSAGSVQNGWFWKDMFKRLLLVLSLVVIISNSCTRTIEQRLKGLRLRIASYQLLRETRIGAFSEIEVFGGSFGSSQYIPLRNSGDWYLTIGGEPERSGNKLEMTTGANSRT